MLPITYRNPFRRQVRGFFLVAVIAAAIGVACLALRPVIGAHTQNEGASAALLTIGIVGLICAGMTALIGVCILPMARQAERRLEEFRRHECLVEWTYPAEQWARYIQSESKRIRRAGMIAATLVAAVCSILGGAVGFIAGITPAERVTGGSIAVAASLAVGAIIVAGTWIYIRIRSRRLAQWPEAVLSRQALFCGGDFVYWDNWMIALRSARMLGGEVPQLEFITVAAGALAAAGVVADAVSAISSGHTSGQASSWTWRYTVPIPLGKEDEASAALEKILEAVKSPAARPRAATVAASANKSAIEVRPAAPEYAAIPRGRPAATWWWITLGLLLVGLVLLIGSQSLHDGASTGTAVTGLLMWVAAPFALLIAIIRTVRHRRVKQGV